MKLVPLLLFVAIFQLSASTYSQTTLLKISGQNLSIGEIFESIERQSEFSFFYNVKQIDISKRVDINAENQFVNKILDEILVGTGMTYSINNKLIVIHNQEETVEKLDVQQQEKKIIGKVTDQAGVSIPGATVILKGTTTGTITDNNGSFTLRNVPDKSTLVCSFVGMRSIEIAIGDKTEVSFVLIEETIGIEEVVAIGYGMVKKSDLTGSVGSLKSESIVRSNPVQPANALQGKVAGVNVSKVNSRPGSDYSIDIRGVHSISFSSEPLVVIDGVMGGKLNTLNPSDIETMDVLKDASATAIYGARGANGVILITTKKGKKGKTKVTYDGYVGVKVPILPELMTAQSFYVAHNDVVKAENPNASIIWATGELANVNGGKTVDWVDQVTDPSTQQSHVVSLSGGNENTTHYFSAGYLNEKGNLLNTGYERYNLKGSIESKLNEMVKVGFTTYFTYSRQNLGSKEALRSAYRARPTGTILYSDLTNPTETNDKSIKGYAFWMGIKDTQVENPILEVSPDAYKDEFRNSNFLGNGYIELTLLKGLSFKSSLSTSLFSSREGIFQGADSKGRLNKLPAASNSIQFNGSYTLDNILNYKLQIGKHNIGMTAVQSAVQERFESEGASVENLSYNSDWYALSTASAILSVTSGLTHRTIQSYMGRLNYNYSDKYLMTLTGRYDGASVLAEGNKWAFFPSVAFAWRAVDESFVKKLNTFSDLKVRLSYGEVGNDVVAPYSTQAYLAKTAYDFNSAAAYGYAPKNIGNSSLKWEKSAEFNFGLNLGFLNNRIMADVEFYKKTTNDLIQNVAVPTSLGFSAVTANVGKLENKGVEVSLNTVNVQTKDFKWNTTINFSSNQNKIIELYGGSVTSDIANKLFVGKPLRANFYYQFDGIWQNSEATEAAKYGQVPGSVKVVDQNNDGKISSSAGSDDRVYLGTELPKWIGGINNTISYKQWDFSFFIYTRQKSQFKNAMLAGTMGELGGRYNHLNLNYWTTDNPTNDYYGVWQANPYREAIQYQDASFWRLSNITLGYTLPNTLLDRLKFSRMRCYVQANNPFVYTKKKIWMDPEFNSGAYQDDVSSSTIIFGVNISF